METRNDRSAVFTYLMNSNSVVKCSVGTVIKGFVNHDYVVLHEAPPRVVSEVIQQFKMISLTSEGLLIPITPLPKE